MIDEQPVPETDEEAKRYIPKEAHGLYRTYRDMGISIIESIQKAPEGYLGWEAPKGDKE